MASTSTISKLLNFSSFLLQNTAQLLRNGMTNAVKLNQPVRSNWTDWRMMKDNRRRKLLVEHAADRVRAKALKKNDVLPAEITEIGAKMLAEIPRDASLTRVRNRCAITSRPRGVVTRWRLSRIVWRSLADYNKLSGVQRAMW
ncbi:small ribosomal subunit protein uS14m-like [Daphnia carinata]|uniref:small ribosomal subunit protein uS14m-like n=1 Tax=Daphnia carinata TaxID=120202 RepID=UPI00257F18CF|nr:small ribosomal subunit protein uS14m-like [Daphnia carinata]